VTVVGDLYSVRERARVQGYIASVWGASSIVGPTLGGVFSQFLDWRWIFFVNLPIGVVAVRMLWRSFHEDVHRTRRPLDLTGALLLTAGFSLLVLGLLESGVAWPWASATTGAVFGASAVALVAFVLVERRAAEPVLPLWVFRRRVLLGSNLGSLAIGVVLIGLTSYVPTYVQGVLGTGALVAGFALAAMTVGWPIAATYSGRLYTRIGFRDTALIGGVFVVIGSVLMTRVGAQSSVWAVAAAAFVIGIGLGLASSPTVVAVQSVVGWDRRGVVTGTNMFARSIGSAVGAAVLGAIANATLSDRFAHPPAAVAGHLPPSVDATSTVLAGAQHSSAAVTAFVRSALQDATHDVFVASVVIAIGTLLAIAMMPRHTEPLVFPSD
jgi:MFS family permease